MNIKKVFYRKIRIAGKEKVILHRKVVLEKISDFYYICKEYKWSKDDKQWYPIGPCAFFDGVKLRDTGIVKTRPLEDVDNYFKTLMQYELYKPMLASEVPDSAEEELNYLEKVNGEGA